MFESLESRRLLSAGITVTQSGGALTIRGGADGTVFLNVIETGGSVQVEDNGVPVSGSPFAGVASIKISGQAQTDNISYSGDSIGAVVNSGGGNDFLIVNDHGTAGSYISGDGGDDDLTVLDANRTTLIGDGGADTLYVSNSVSITREVYLYGMGGSDIINIAGGKNFVFGGGGFDSLITNGVEGVNFELAVVNSIESTSGF